MKVCFDKIEEKILTNVRGGDGTASLRLGGDDKCKIQHLTLKKGCSIGNHQHIGNCEMYYVLSGVATIIDDGETYELSAGGCQYCPEQHMHGIRNDHDEDLVFLGIIAN